MSDKNIDLTNYNNGDAVVSNNSLLSPCSGIYSILDMLDYLQSELADIDETAGHLVQMCKAELLQKLAMEAMTRALRRSPAQINAEFDSLSQAFASDMARKVAIAQTTRDSNLSIARHINQARLDIAAKGVKERSLLIKQLAHEAKVAHEKELARLLACEEADDRRHGDRGAH